MEYKTMSESQDFLKRIKDTIKVMEDQKLQSEIAKLFDAQGNCLADPQSYFNDEGDLKEYWLIRDEYSKYPAKSDIVKMFYAEEFANTTHGNYNASTLYYRA